MVGLNPPSLDHLGLNVLNHDPLGLDPLRLEPLSLKPLSLNYGLLALNFLPLDVTGAFMIISPILALVLKCVSLIQAFVERDS